jgi:two-component sensor histidine kinase
LWHHSERFFTSPEGWNYMTPERRLDRAERILLQMVKAGRRARSEWQYKINSLVDAQIRHEEQWRIESAKTEEALKQTAANIARLAESHESLAKEHKLTEEALRKFIERQK